MLTPEQVQQIITDTLPDAIAALKKEVAAKVVAEAQWALGDEIKNTVREWIKTNIAPEIEKSLIDSKDGILKAIAEFTNSYTSLLTKALLEDASAKLANSWDRKKIVEAILTK